MQNQSEQQEKTKKEKLEHTNMINPLTVLARDK